MTLEMGAPAYLFFPPTFPVILLFGLLGVVVGSFLNVLILRLPVMLSHAWQQEIQAYLAQSEAHHNRPNQEVVTAQLNLFYPRSHCPNCLNTLSPIHLIPLISWIALRGRCAACHEAISIRYPLIELLTALLSGASAIWWGGSATTLAALFFIWVLIALAWIDIDHLLLPDTLTQPLLWAGLIANFFGLFVPFGQAFWGAVGGYVFLWALYWLFRLFSGKEGIGQGDFKLLAALGAWLGWHALPGLLLIASLSGAGYGLLAIIFEGHSRQTPIPFGPFLALSGLVLLFFPFNLEF